MITFLLVPLFGVLFIACALDYAQCKVLRPTESVVFAIFPTLLLALIGLVTKKAAFLIPIIIILVSFFLLMGKIFQTLYLFIIVLTLIAASVYRILKPNERTFEDLQYAHLELIIYTIIGLFPDVWFLRVFYRAYEFLGKRAQIPEFDENEEYVA